ncbi:hypothetical protein [Mesorhizobium sp.]|uniref:hypothetical protein n=1 Tax=Mesorhizobium sp. TaxID=1871066 RepID=UPI001219202E|nr:hypothetical protein [Mesorhizobium sp.]TIN76713.1 MAG: hypothetical protein E5Y09_20695 [Mesorhizobium sp.]
MEIVNSGETWLAGKGWEALAHPLFGVVPPYDGLCDSKIASKHRQILDPQWWWLDRSSRHQTS